MSTFFVRKKANFKMRRALVADNFSTQRTLSSSSISEKKKKNAWEKSSYLCTEGNKVNGHSHLI